ncbi:unnamed protein product [Effrenium voratum]|uniref:FH2 domain-containing protein n=1 Tax=Effrenium voratum TaxID=2562239 RepID=A0AA36ILB0_9DINO|nr:unnamed protein product [Effrenium voratum]
MAANLSPRSQLQEALLGTLLPVLRLPPEELPPRLQKLRLRRVEDARRALSQWLYWLLQSDVSRLDFELGNTSGDEPLWNLPEDAPDASCLPSDSDAKSRTVSPQPSGKSEMCISRSLPANWQEGLETLSAARRGLQEVCAFRPGARAMETDNSTVAGRQSTRSGRRVRIASKEVEIELTAQETDIQLVDGVGNHNLSLPLLAPAAAQRSEHSVCPELGTESASSLDATGDSSGLGGGGSGISGGFGGSSGSICSGGSGGSGGSGSIEQKDLQAQHARSFGTAGELPASSILHRDCTSMTGGSAGADGSGESSFGIGPVAADCVVSGNGCDIGTGSNCDNARCSIAGSGNATADDGGCSGRGNGDAGFGGGDDDGMGAGSGSGKGGAGIGKGDKSTNQGLTGHNGAANNVHASTDGVSARAAGDGDQIEHNFLRSKGQRTRKDFPQEPRDSIFSFGILSKGSGKLSVGSMESGKLSVGSMGEDGSDDEKSWPTVSPQPSGKSEMCISRSLPANWQENLETLSSTRPEVLVRRFAGDASLPGPVAPEVRPSSLPLTISPLPANLANPACEGDRAREHTEAQDGSSRPRAASDPDRRGPAAPVDRRHSDILPLRDPAYGNVAQKVAVYEAFRQICTLSKTSFDEGAGAAGGDLPCRAGTGGTAGPASPARYRCSGSGESRVPERRDLSPASPLLSSCPSPEPRSKQWILQRLVDAGALPLQEEDKFLQSLGRASAQAAHRNAIPGLDLSQLPAFGGTVISTSVKSSEASTPGDGDFARRLQELETKNQKLTQERHTTELELQRLREEKEKAILCEKAKEVNTEKGKAQANDKDQKDKEEERQKDKEDEDKNKEDKKAKGKGKAKGPKGKAPPAGLAKGKSKGKGETQSCMPEVQPRTAMKKLFWSPLKGDASQSVWAKIHQSGADFDVDELEANFSEVFSTGSVSPVKRPAVQQKHRRVFDEKRRREIWFMLALMPERSQLLEAVEGMSDAILLPEKVELLQMNLPTAADVQLINDSVNSTPLAEGEEWDAPEDFVLAISSIPHYELRVKMWGFLNSVDFAHARLMLAHQELCRGAEILMRSKALERLLALVLFVGNYLNGGTARGRAEGFDLETLPKLSKLRGRGSETLLDYLVSQTESAEPGLLGALFRAGAEEEMVKRARKHRVVDLLDELKCLIGQAEGFLGEGLAADGANAALIKRKVQVEQVLGKLRAARLSFETEWDPKYEQLCLWFQQEGKRGSEEFFGIWESFLGDLKKAWECHQREHLQIRRALSLPPRRRSVGGEVGSKTPRSSPRPSLRRKTAHNFRPVLAAGAKESSDKEKAEAQPHEKQKEEPTEKPKEEPKEEQKEEEEEQREEDEEDEEEEEEEEQKEEEKAEQKEEEKAEQVKEEKAAQEEEEKAEQKEEQEAEQKEEQKAGQVKEEKAEQKEEEKAEQKKEQEAKQKEEQKAGQKEEQEAEQKEEQTAEQKEEQEEQVRHQDKSRV